ncbi:MAG: hypothetical protein Q9175_005219 [Cornicularia normoerica]
MKTASHWDKPTIKLGKRDETEVAIFWVKDRDAVVRAQLCWEEAHIRTIFHVASSRSVKWVQKNERRYPDMFDVRLKGFLQFPNPNKVDDVSDGSESLMQVARFGQINDHPDLAGFASNIAIYEHRVGHACRTVPSQIPALLKDLPPTPVILGNACGTGAAAEGLLKVLPSARIYAADVMPAMVQSVKASSLQSRSCRRVLSKSRS